MAATRLDIGKHWLLRKNIRGFFIEKQP